MQKSVEDRFAKFKRKLQGGSEVKRDLMLVMGESERETMWWTAAVVFVCRRILGGCKWVLKEFCWCGIGVFGRIGEGVVGVMGCLDVNAMVSVGCPVTDICPLVVSPLRKN